MRILVLTLGSGGDVRPFVALGRTLRERGHRVELWANEHFRDWVEEAGLAWRPAGTAAEYQAALADPDLFHPRRALRTVAERAIAPAIPLYVAALLEALKEGADVVVASTLSFGARIVRDLDDTPLVTVHLAPACLPSVVDPPHLVGLRLWRGRPLWPKRLALGLVDRLTDRTLAPAIDAERRRHGLGAVRRVFSRWVHSPDRVLGMWPPFFAAPPEDAPERLRLPGFPLDHGQEEAPSADVARWVEADRPPLVVTPGTAHLHADELLGAAVDAALARGERVLVVGGRMGTVSGPEERVRQVAWCPFRWLLGRAGALVSHGGIGTVAEALLAGCPHLVVPQAFDQADNGRRVAELGAGVVVRRLGRLGGALDRLRAAGRGPAQAVSARIQAGSGLARAAALVEAAARGA